MADIPIPRKLWDPPNPKGTLAYKFMQEVNRRHNTSLETWQDLHAFSVDQRATFWGELFQQHPLIHSGSYTKVVDESARMDSNPAWFEGVEVNFAENALLWPDTNDPTKSTTYRKEDWRVACTEAREGGTEIRPCTWKELRERTAHLANAMRARGVKKGDRVAVVASNSIDTLVVFYAVTSLGGIFSSSSTDMGTKGILDRLRQIKPKYVFVDDGALYNGKTFDLRPRFAKIGSSVDDAICIVGEKDANLPETMKEMRDKIQEGFEAAGKSNNIDLVIIKNAGHVSFVDGFGQFTAEVLKWLKD